ncbi:MAG: FhaA domain-containing protein [Candidatus Limnocylindrales bacterium]
MAGPLAAVERFIERLFERPAARLFQARLEPIQIQRSLERAMEAERTVHARRAYAPTSYRVLVNAQDHAVLDPQNGPLRADLSESLRVYARAHGYTLLARPRVDIEPSTVVPQGDMKVIAAPIVLPAATITNGHDHAGRPSYQPSPVDKAFGQAVDAPAFDLSQATAVFAAPTPTTMSAVMAIRCPGQAVLLVTVRPGTMRLGRSLDNDIVLADERVSRRHGQISVRMGMLVYTDLGSTNGSYLNSGPVTEIALGPGDVLQVGSSTITIEPGS